MQIDQDLEAGLLCPVKSVVERFVAMDKRTNIIKQKIWYRNSYRIEAVFRQSVKVILCDIGVAVILISAALFLF